MSRPARFSLPLLVQIVALAAAYVVVARLGLMMDARAGFATLVWPSSGLALAALLLAGSRLWPGVAIGALLANLWVGAPLGVAIGISVGNTLEAVLGAYALRRIPGFTPSLGRLKDAGALIVLGAFCSTTVSATIGVTSLFVGGIVTQEGLAETWVAWWLGDVIGDLIVAPLLLVWARGPRFSQRPRRIVEASCLGVAIVATIPLVHGQWSGGHAMAQAFLFYPLLIWAALRFGQRGAVTAMFFIVVITIWGTALGRGPFVREDLYESLLALQAFMAITSMTFLVLGASIVERGRATQVLLESEALKAGILDAALDSIITIDHRGRVIEFNVAAERTFGFTSDQVLGQEMMTLLIAPTAREQHREAFDQLLATGEGPLLGQRFEVIALRADSSEFPAEIAITPVRSTGSRLLTGHVRDLTELKRSEAESELQFRTMIEWMPQLAWWAKPDGFIDYYNPRWYEYTGTTPKDMEGWGWKSVHDPALLPKVMERWQHSIATGEPFEMEFPLRGADGRFRWFLTRVTPMRNHDDEIIRWIGINTDIDDQKKALELVGDTLESMSDAFFLLDRNYRIVLVNHNQERVSQTSRADTVGRSFWEVFPSTAQPSSKYWTEYHRVMEERSAVHFEEYYAPLDIWTEVDAFPSRDGGIAVFFRDISARKRDEQHRAQLLDRERDARAQAESANRAKDEFMAMLGHELRNPLAPILTALQIMRLRDPTVAERERGVIERQVTHLVRLVDDMLDISKITRGMVELSRQRLDLAEIAAKAIETASPLLEQRRHRLIADVPAGLFIDGDAQRLQQVFSNLLTNSAKYTPPGGQITIKAERVAETVVTRISDNGIGIGPDLLPNVFDLFVQGRQDLDRSQGGLGLGLAIVRRLVELHGGQVTVESGGAGQGATFSVTLPAVEASQHVAQPQPRAAMMAAEAKNKPVLIVDDNEDALELLAELLRSHGYETRTAHDGPTALELLDQFTPDVAILDIGLPVMDGFELARRVRDRPDLRSIRLIALTGYGQPSDRERASKAGFDFHLVKPVDIDRLAALLEAAPRRAR